MSAEPLYGWWHLVFDSHTSMPPSPASLVYSVLVRNGSVNEVEFLGPILKKWLGPKVVRTNEIARLFIITYNTYFPYKSKFLCQILAFYKADLVQNALGYTYIVSKE